MVFDNSFEDDVSLICECIENELDFSKLPDEGTTQIIVQESGEWEGYNWIKYYEIIRVCVLS